MIADAIRDVTSRNEIVLNAFPGSDPTIIACAKVRRRGYALELDPHYVGVRRWNSGPGARATGCILAGRVARGLLAFLNGRHDDQVDSTSQALDYLTARTHPLHASETPVSGPGAYSDLGASGGSPVLRGDNFDDVPWMAPYRRGEQLTAPLATTEVP